MAMRRRGRPRRNCELASVRIWALITPSEHAVLQAAASENRQSLAALIRDAITDYVAEFSEKQIFLHR